MRILSLAILAVVNCLYFEITEKDKKCFIEELPDDTQMIGKYLVQVFDKTSKEWKQSAPGFGMHVEVHDPRNKAVLSRAYGSQGRFTFTSHLPGEHKICLMANSTNWSWSGGKLRVHLDLQIGEDREGYKEIADREKLTELQLRVRQLLDQVQQIQKEQNFQRFREERFRQTSESTNAKVFWWATVQIFILVGAGLWQMRHLKGFFEAKKLV